MIHLKQGFIKMVLWSSIIVLLLACKNNDERYIFFLHDRFLELHALDALHPEYGKSGYLDIISEFENHGFNVISEKRNGNVNAREYAQLVTLQIDSLIKKGIPANHITVVGSSKGGYIAQYVSTFAHNPNLNFVFIASFRESDLLEIPEIDYCGNILNIFEASDPYGVSAQSRLEGSSCSSGHFKEIELHTGLKHGFLFRPLSAWMEPTLLWAKGHYDLED